MFLMLGFLVATLSTSQLKPPPRLPTEFASVTTEMVVLPSGAKGLRVSITNHCQQPMTAWRVNAEAALSDGTKRFQGLAADGYLAYEGVAEQEGVGFIRPDESKSALIVLPGSATLNVDSSQAFVLWAIFADRTWSGDPRGAQEAFIRRENERKDLEAIIQSLRAGIASASESQALRIALAQLSPADNDGEVHLTKQTMRKNLEMALDGRIKTSPREFLRGWLAKTESLFAAADKHRQPSSIRESK